MDQIKIGKFIALRRRDAGLTQEQLAEQLGVSNRTVSNWETGKHMPDLSLFSPLCELLGITLTELMSGEALPVNEDTMPAERAVQNTVYYAETQISRSHRLLSGGLLALLAVFCFLGARIASRAFSLELNVWGKSCLFLLAAAVILIPAWWIARKKGRQLSPAPLFLALTGYVLLLLDLKLFSGPGLRLAGGFARNLIPTATIRACLTSPEGVTVLLGNLLLFLPVALGLRLLIPEKPQWAISWAALFALLTELCQALFFGGIFDIDDLLLNFLGILAGWFLAGILLRDLRPLKSFRHQS